MKTREELRERYEKDLRELETKERITALLPAIEGLEVDMIHVYKLYDRQGTIRYGDSYHSNDKKVTLAQLAALLKAFPPVQTVKAKGSFTRFITEAFADSDMNKERGKEELTLIFPVTLKTNSVTGYTLKAEWFTELDGQTWEVEAVLANPYSLAQVSARRVDFRGGFRYEDARLSVSTALNPPDGYWQQVKWGRGSDEYPNDFTAYHCQYDLDPVTWVKDAIKTLESDKVFQAAI